MPTKLTTKYSTTKYRSLPFFNQWVNQEANRAMGRRADAIKAGHDIRLSKLEDFMTDEDLASYRTKLAKRGR